MPEQKAGSIDITKHPTSVKGNQQAFLLAAATALLIAAPAFQESLWPLTWGALVPLFLALRTASPGRAFLLGWWTETLSTWLGFYWLIGTMVRFGYIAVPLSVLFFGIIGIGNGVRLGLFAWWIRLTRATNGPWWYHLFLPACTYVALDYLFPRVFPWYLGFTQLPAKLLIQTADLTGVHGITFLLVASSIVGASFFPHPGQAARTARPLLCLVFGSLVLLNVAYSIWRMPQVTRAMQQAPTLRLGLIQPNIGIYEKGDRANRPKHLRLQADMSRALLAQQPDLIIWPETMYPYLVPTHTTHLDLPSGLENRDVSWLIGALTYEWHDSQRQVFNSALLLAPDTRILGRYNKQKLLAFGEYIPLKRYVPFLRNLSPTIGNLTPGSGGLVTLPNGVSIGPLICYEDILPALGRQAVRQGAQLLVNLTNDAWFGRTRAPFLHRSLAAFRAIENRVYLVRVTNTGLTSIIDALGREQLALPLYQRMASVHTIEPLQLSTLYTRFGDWFAQLSSILTLLLPLVGRQQPKEGKTKSRRL
jgi:apolipoprotein N-acyltransferase